MFEWCQTSYNNKWQKAQVDTGMRLVYCAELMDFIQGVNTATYSINGYVDHSFVLSTLK